MAKYKMVINEGFGKPKKCRKSKRDEVIQLYLKDLLSSLSTYGSVLRRFERVTLIPGEDKM